MEALKKIDIEELLKRQETLDEKFDEKDTLRKRTVDRIMIAYYTELGELFQELKSEWNYWKNSTRKIDRRRVLEELSDTLHFYLSYLNNTRYLKIGKVEAHKFKSSLKDFEEAFYLLSSVNIRSINHILGAMLYVAEYVGATEKEFLQIHHEVWLRNTEERTKGEY